MVNGHADEPEVYRDPAQVAEQARLRLREDPDTASEWLAVTGRDDSIVLTIMALVKAVNALQSRVQQLEWNREDDAKAIDELLDAAHEH